jgi:WD40 repeat protein
VGSTKRIVAVGRKLHFFDYEKIELPQLTDECPLVMALYNPITYTFITFSNRFVKIWDAYHGTVQRVYRNLSETDITSSCLDFRLRKFILGDHDGKLLCFDFMNGAEMKEFAYDETNDAAHMDEISKLAYCDEHATLISTSWDRSIAIHDEAEAEEGVLLRRITNSHKSDITALAHSYNLSLIATGSADSCVKIWDYEFVRLEANLVGHTSAITCVLFLDPLPCLISCDVGGNVLLWATRPSKVKNKILTRWKHRPANKNGAKPTAAAITSLCASWQDGETEADETGGGGGPEGSKRRGGKDEEKDEGKEQEDEPTETETFVETSLESSEDAQRWLARLKKLTKNRKSKLGKEADQTKLKKFLLYAGDERGNVVVWDLLPTLESLMEEYGSTAHGVGVVETPVDCGNERRHITYDASIGGGGDLNGTSKSWAGTDENNMAVSSDAVTLLKMWHAHSDAINNIQLIKEPPSLLTCSLDKLAKVWEHNGRPLGVLRAGGSKPGEWKFTYDQKGIQKAKLSAGGDIMEEVKEMGELVIPSDSEDEDDGTYTVDLDGIGFQETAFSIRKTPKRIPVNASNVGRRRRMHK